MAFKPKTEQEVTQKVFLVYGNVYAQKGRQRYFGKKERKQNGEE